LKYKESRKYPRVVVDLPVEILSEGRASRDRATTLSGGGIRLAITAPLRIGSEIRIRFRPAKHLPIIEAKARVLYQIPKKGTAIEFTEIDAQQREALLRLIVHRRRAHSRARLVAQVDCPQCMSLALSRDISEGGMFIETHQPLAVGTRLKLRFHIDADEPIVAAEVVVAYEVVDLGMGVQFVEISEADRARIAAYVVRSQR